MLSRIFGSGARRDLSQGLRERHIAMIAIGGSIGTGLFVSSGVAIHTAGPAGTMFALSLMAVMIYFVMTSLSEMAAHYPTPGSFCTYCTEYVGPSFGLSMSVNYYFNWAITIAAELSAAAIIMQYWFPGSSFMMWASLFFAVIILINLASVKVYGECEFWLSMLKVVAIVMFIGVGIYLIATQPADHHVMAENWSVGFHGFKGGWQALFITFIVAAFSFQGVELLGVAAGEAEQPEKSIPRAAKTIFWRIVIFYLGTMLIISSLIGHNDERLIHADTQHIAMSPFTIVLMQSGLDFAASLMNGVILIAVLSAANSNVYSATRILYSMARDNQAPKFFERCMSNGVPIFALMLTCCFGATVFLSSLWGTGQVFFWLLNISSLSGIVAWLGIAISHLAFRKKLAEEGKSVSSLPYIAKGFPTGPRMAVLGCIILIIGQMAVMYDGQQFNWETVLSTYIILPILLTIGFVHRWKCR